MSNIPRKSLLPTSQASIPRRSSSADIKWASANATSASGSQVTSSASGAAGGRQSMIDGRQSISSSNLTGRASSVGCSGRQSLMGRPSMSGKQPGEQRSNSEMAYMISSVLQLLESKTMYSAKDLCQPNTSTFYTVFEELLNAIGIVDVWNTKLLEPQNEPKSKQAMNQQQQPNPASQNKARLELIIFHLNMLRYQYIPKLNILQSMSTPKNWTCMLQILNFLSLCWKFLNCVNIPKFLSAIVPDREITFKYMKEAYKKSLEDANYVTTESHRKLQHDFLKKYEIHLRGTFNLKQLQQDRDLHRGQFEFLESTKNELEDLHKEEQELMCKLAVIEKSKNDANKLFEEKHKFLKNEKKEVQSFHEKLAAAEKELSVKDLEYDKQLASQTNGNHIENLPVKHQQKVEELENLQSTFIDLENKIDEVHSKQIQKTTEIKVAISSANDLVNKIMLSSSMSVDKFPQLDVLDFHKKRDLFKDYKEKIHKIREKYVSDICKLPEQFSQVKAEKKMIESKLEQSKIIKAQHLEDIKRFENQIAKLHKESEEALSLINLEHDKLNKLFIDKERLHKTLLEELNKEKLVTERVFNEHKKVEVELESELKTAKERQSQSLIEYENAVREKEKKTSEYINQKTDNLLQIKKMVADFLAKDKIEKAAWDIENRRILESLEND